MTYKSFSVGPANSQYQLSISGFTGVTTDPFDYGHLLNDTKFTTKDRDNDRDNDKDSITNCALNRDCNNAGR